MGRIVLVCNESKTKRRPSTEAEFRDGPTLTAAMAALEARRHRMQAPLVHAMTPCLRVRVRVRVRVTVRVRVRVRVRVGVRVGVS